MQRHHRVLCACFVEDEKREQDEAADQRQHYERVREAESRRFDQAVNYAGESDRGEGCAGPVEPSVMFFLATLRDFPERNDEHCNREWQIQEERGAPTQMFHQPAAEHWSNRGSNRGKSRPRSDRFTTLVFVEGSADEGETSRHEQCAADSLHCASDDQLLDVRSKAAERGGNREDHDADVEDATASIAIAERTADEQQRGEKERVSLDDPLYTDRGGVEIGLQER